MRQNDNKRNSKIDDALEEPDVEYMREYIIRFMSNSKEKILIRMLYVRAKNLEKLV